MGKNHLQKSHPVHCCRTSGARISVLEPVVGTDSPRTTYREIFSESLLWNDENGAYDEAEAWMRAIRRLLKAAEEGLGGLKGVRSICVSGTSASCLMVDRQNLQVTRSPRMYSYDILSAAKSASSNGEDKKVIAAEQAIEMLNKHAPPKHTARARTGSLAKLLSWNQEEPVRSEEVLCHQADYCSMHFLWTASPVNSDWHNCLKLGYDVRNLEWPAWMETCLTEAGMNSPFGGEGTVPLNVVAPGSPMGTVNKDMAMSLGLPLDTVIVGGTTDSNAAFFAAAGTQPTLGTAVTSLGSTLAMKQLSQTYVEDANLGVYSHRFPNFENPDVENWLVGGASNVGCAILRDLHSSDEELESLSSQIDPTIDSTLEYYPLTKRGERFPIADPDKEPITTPIPNDRKEYLHGILQSIGNVERDGFVVLKELGAPPPSLVWTCGGGSKNDVWTLMRQRRLAAQFPEATVEVRRASSTEASFGAALLAAASFAK